MDMVLMSATCNVVDLVVGSVKVVSVVGCILGIGSAAACGGIIAE